MPATTKVYTRKWSREYSSGNPTECWGPNCDGLASYPRGEAEAGGREGRGGGGLKHYFWSRFYSNTSGRENYLKNKMPLSVFPVFPNICLKHRSRWKADTTTCFERGRIASRLLRAYGQHIAFETKKYIKRFTINLERALRNLHKSAEEVFGKALKNTIEKESERNFRNLYKLHILNDFLSTECKIIILFETFDCKSI